MESLSVHNDGTLFPALESSRGELCDCESQGENTS